MSSTSSSAAQVTVAAAACDDAPDADLAVRAQAGDARAFAVLLRRHGALLRRTAITRSRLAADADDVVQEAVLKVWQSLPSLREPSKVRAWMVQIVAREAVRVSTARQQDRLDALTDDVAPLSGPDAHVDRFDLHDGLRTALRSLPEHAARAWLLREAEGLSYREIAKRLEAPESSVRGWLVLARKRIQGAIDACCPSARPANWASALPEGSAVVQVPARAAQPVATVPPPPVVEASAVAVRSPLHEDRDLPAPGGLLRTSGSTSPVASRAARRRPAGTARR